MHPDNKAFIYIVEKQRALQDIPEVIRSSYIVSKKLGRGAFGEVRLLFTPDGSAKVAMKCVDKFCYRDVCMLSVSSCTPYYIIIYDTVFTFSSKVTTRY